LKSCKKSGKEKKQFEFKEQENVKDFIEQQEKKQMMKEFTERMKKI
jgi:hypothetical protein